jgi:hypothetical protein
LAHSSADATGRDVRGRPIAGARLLVKLAAAASST